MNNQPPSYKVLLSLEKAYYRTRYKANSVWIKTYFMMRQKLIRQCLYEVETDLYAMPLGLIKMLRHNFDELIEGYKPNDFIVIDDKQGRRKDCRAIMVAKRIAVSYVHFCVAGFFEDQTPRATILTFYGIHKNTLVDWLQETMPYEWVFSSEKDAENAIAVMGEIYQNSGKAFSNHANMKK